MIGWLCWFSLVSVGYISVSLLMFGVVCSILYSLLVG